MNRSFVYWFLMIGLAAVVVSIFVRDTFGDFLCGVGNGFIFCAVLGAWIKPKS